MRIKDSLHFAVSVLILLILSSVTASAEPLSVEPSIQWQTSIGGTDYDCAYCIQQTSDGNYIAGRSYHDMTAYHERWDAYVVKLNSDGSILWQYPILASVIDSICQISDGSYVAASSSDSAWRISKLDSTGKIIGSKDIEGSVPHSVQPTSDGGCIVAGLNTNHASVVKLDQNLNIIWSKSYYISSDAFWAQQTSDGGYVVALYDGSNGWIYKLDANGDTIWKKTYGGTRLYRVFCVQQTTDGGYISTGDIFLSDLPGYHNGYDCFTVKVDASGNIQWQKCFGGYNDDFSRRIQQTSDGGYIVFGNTESIDGDVTGNNGGPRDGWLYKLDANGNMLWNKCIGDVGYTNGAGYDSICSGQQTSDGGYIIAGESNSYHAEHGGYVDAWIVKLTPEVNSKVPIANFTATPISGTVPINVSFTDTSTGAPTSWEWDFGDGTTSSEQSINHTYTTAGTYNVDLNVSNSNGYSSKTVQINVLKATPTITWMPVDLTYGTGLGDAQLNAVASVSGTFTYTPSAGTVLSAGDNQNLHVEFIPTDTTNYDQVSFDSKVNVLKATPTVTWNQPDNILAGTTLDRTQLNAIASVPGTFDYTPAAGTLLNAGMDQQLQVVFTPTDKENYNTVTGYTKINVLTPPPSINSIAVPLDPVPVGTSITTSADVTYLGSMNELTGEWDLGDESISKSQVLSNFEVSHVYNSPGIYTVTFTVKDNNEGFETKEAPYYVVVYDPQGGFVTGSGWINSPAGAYVQDTTLVGKAMFGFVSKYEKGATVPTGRTEFQFKVADLNFRSEEYDWLVVAGSQAKYKGTGTINGEGNYGFMLSAVDGAIKGDNIDKFRIKIWDKENGDKTVYDNEIDSGIEIEDAEPSTIVSGGSILIHNRK